MYVGRLGQLWDTLTFQNIPQHSNPLNTPITQQDALKP